MTRALNAPVRSTSGRLWPAALALSVLAGTAALPDLSFAQQAPPGQARDGCAQPPHASATPPASGPSSGTAPGGSGSTGWTGDAGIGMTPQAPPPGSPTQHPPTVTGVNPRPDEQKPC